jgi:uncharacterized RDD family membrane protein YckC
MTNNPYAPPRAIVEDIADSGAPVIEAERGTRLGAAILDGIIMFGMVYVPFLIAVFGQGFEENTEFQMTPVTMIGGVLTVIGFVAWCWLNILYVSRNGQSIAKKILGIKVVRSDGSPASLGRIFWLRNIVNGLLGVIPLYGLIDVLFIFSESRQCLHDKIADTIVVVA